MAHGARWMLVVGVVAWLAGATLDAANERVHIPRRLVEGALRTANRHVTLYSRDGRNDLDLSVVSMQHAVVNKR